MFLFVFQLHENSSFKQQMSILYSQRDKAMREMNKLRETQLKLQQHYDDSVKEGNALRVKATKELKRLTEERNATMREYNLIMSER